ncbi:MAG: PadR family transcriptional regulator, partial [Actinobacteria bacterium]|nr:PadR family transcriptional regulator [Actinomycetota bacterium]
PAEANVTVVALRAVLTVREQQALGGDSTMKHRDVAGDSYCTTCPFRDDDNRLSRLGINSTSPTGVTMDPAALYRTLRALEEEGSVRSRWAGAERGAPRRVYALTDAGEAGLRQSLAAVADQRDTLARLVDRGLAHPLTQPSPPSTSPAGHAARLLQSV